MITDDAQVLLLLCSTLGLQPEEKTITPKEWSAYAQKLQLLEQKPGKLLDWGVAQLQRNLEIKRNEAERIAILLERGGALAIELERLSCQEIFPLTLVDDDYPERYRQRLRESAPPVLFYSGNKELLGQKGVAVVGSRNLNEAEKEQARTIGSACGFSGMVLYSGGAKGVDELSMIAALEAWGSAVAVLAYEFEETVRKLNKYLQKNNLCLITPYNPKVHFNVRNAMARNRLIYTLADYAIVITSRIEGGTWAGATEALKKQWIPVFVLEYEGMSEGNKLLLQKGAIPLPYQDIRDNPKHFKSRLEDWQKYFSPRKFWEQAKLL